MLKNLFVKLNLEVLIFCSKKSSVITLSFESYSVFVSSSLEIPSESTYEEISVNGLEEPSNKLFAGKCDNYNINYSENLLRLYKILIMILVQVLAFWIKERRNHYNHNLHLLHSNVSINLYNY